MKYFTILGERCSGTNYLEKLIETNFDIELTYKYCHKHFFGFNNFNNSDDTLFICIVRNPIDWINSLYRTPWHISENNKISLYNFLNTEICSYNDKYFEINDGKEMINDRNIYTGQRYKNLFELRYTKIKFLLEDLPNKVSNYIFIRHEDLLNDFNNTMNKIKDKGLKIKENINFPLNSKSYKKGDSIFTKKVNYIPSIIIFRNPNYNYAIEKSLGY